MTLRGWQSRDCVCHPMGNVDFVVQPRSVYHVTGYYVGKNMKNVAISCENTENEGKCIIFFIEL